MRGFSRPFQPLALSSSRHVVKLVSVLGNWVRCILYPARQGWLHSRYRQDQQRQCGPRWVCPLFPWPGREGVPSAAVGSSNLSENRPSALRLELALIESNPSTPALHALSRAEPSGTGAVTGMINRRRAAFEGQLRNFAASRWRAALADRDMADIVPLHRTRLARHGPAKGIMSRWTNPFVEIVYRKPYDVVTGPAPFTLRLFGHAGTTHRNRRPRWPHPHPPFA